VGNSAVTGSAVGKRYASFGDPVRGAESGTPPNRLGVLLSYLRRQSAESHSPANRTRMRDRSSNPSPALKTHMSAYLCSCGARLSKPGRCRDCERKRNAQPHRVAHRSGWHRRLRAYVFLRDNYRCVDCGATTDLTLDYITPLSRGGQQLERNAVTRCRSCNSGKGANTKRRPIAQARPRFSRQLLR
jgi:5-methylcytosine-specific restriction endonuclease McrA